MEETYIGIEVLKVMENALNYNKSLVKLAIKNLGNVKSIIDFGAGIGTHSDIFKSYGYEVSCLENNVEETNILTQKGYKVLKNIENIPDCSIPCFVSYNVFEHIENDQDVIKQIYKKITNGGFIFIFVPAYQTLYSSFDKRLGHIRRYEKKQFISLLEEANFRIKKWSYFDSFGFITALIYKFINKNGELTKKQVRLFDKFIFPFSRIFDFIFGNFFGKNIYAIAYKQ